MAWEPRVRRHRQRGRRPWYTLTYQKHTHYLGTDRPAAYRRASEILKGTAPKEPPETFAGLSVAYRQATGAPAWQLARFARFAREIPLTDIPPDLLQQYADHIGGATELAPWTVRRDTDHLAAAGKLSPWTVRRYVTYARGLLAWGRDRDYFTTVQKKVRTPQPILIPRDIKIDKLKIAFSKLHPRPRALAEFILATGCRPSEARLLEWKDVDLANGVCVLERHKSSRTGKPRVIYLTPTAKAILEKQPHINKWVFNSRYHKPYTKDGLHTALARVGINSVYSLRHTFAQWFLDTVGDKAELQEWLGHSDSRMIDVYAQVRGDRLKKRAKEIKSPLG